MTEQTPQDLIDALDALLDSERSAVLSGDLHDMEDIVTRKEDLIDALVRFDSVPPQPISEIQDKLARNQMLLDGALQGIRRAAARLAAVRQVRKSLETYGEDGRKKTIESCVARQLEKRA